MKPQEKSKQAEHLKKEIEKLKHIKVKKEPLYQNTLIKASLIIVSVYGALFISKYFVKQYADLIVATKKLWNAKRL